VLDTQGVDSAVGRYRTLRETSAMDGTYDFGEWEMNELARELEVAGRDAEAAAMLELNQEFHPESPNIPRTLGPIYERLGRRDAAIAAYRRALELNPNDAVSAQRLRAIGGG
jgi:Flp pilus assembly protein TadD